MKTIEQSVVDAFTKIIAAGTIEATIEAQLTKTIASAVQQQLESYSDFGKQIGAHVKTALQVDLSKLGLPGYNDLILKVIRAQVDANINAVLGKQIEKQLSALLQPAPDEIKLSKLIADFIEKNSSNDCDCDAPEYISLHISEARHSARWISIDKDPKKSAYACDVRFAISLDDGHIFGLTLEKVNIEKTLFIGDLYGFERCLFQMAASGTKLIIDGDTEDDFDTCYPGRGD